MNILFRSIITHSHFNRFIVKINGKMIQKHEKPTQKSLYYVEIYQTVKTPGIVFKKHDFGGDKLFAVAFFVVMDRIEADMLQFAKKWN